MNIIKIKKRYILVLICCLIIVLFSDIKCMDGLDYGKGDYNYKICRTIQEKEMCLKAYPAAEKGAVVAESSESLSTSQLWSLTKNDNDNHQICSYTSSFLGNRRLCLDATPLDSGNVVMRPRPPTLYPNQLWSLTKEDNGYYHICSNLIKSSLKNGDAQELGKKCLEVVPSSSLHVNFGLNATSPTSHPNQLWKIERIEIDSRYSLFTSGFLSGSAYTLTSEIVRDILEYRGQHNYANIVSTLMQGGVIFYDTFSCAPLITGVATRKIFNYFGFSNQTVAIAGSTAAVVTSVYQNLIYRQEGFLGSMIDCAVAFSGSCVGNMLALKAKNWAYDFYFRGNRHAK